MFFILLVAKKPDYKNANMFRGALKLFLKNLAPPSKKLKKKKTLKINLKIDLLKSNKKKAVQLSNFSNIIIQSSLKSRLKKATYLFSSDFFFNFS